VLEEVPEVLPEEFEEEEEELEEELECVVEGFFSLVLGFAICENLLATSEFAIAVPL
jgi:hypothetical protein